MIAVMIVMLEPEALVAACLDVPFRHGFVFHQMSAVVGLVWEPELTQNFQSAVVDELAKEELESDHQSFQTVVAAAEGVAVAGPEVDELDCVFQSFQSSAAVERGFALLCLETDPQSFQNSALDWFGSDLQSFRTAVAVAEQSLVH